MLKLIVLFGLIAFSSAQFTKLQWSLCGPGVLQVFSMDATPMPVRHPGILNLKLSGKSARTIRGNARSEVKILRTVSGVQLPINCYLVNGQQVGSCTYPDLCGLLNSVLGYNEQNCPQNLIDNGINCKCPFDIPARTLDIDTTADLPDASTTPISWIGSGDFDVTIRASDSLGALVCLNLKFTVRPK